jgi:hypothetical protein
VASFIDEETGVPGENHQLVTSHWQTLSLKSCIEYTTPWAEFKLTTLVVIAMIAYIYIYIGSCKSNYHTITKALLEQNILLLFSLYFEILWRLYTIFPIIPLCEESVINREIWNRFTTISNKENWLWIGDENTMLDKSSNYNFFKIKCADKIKIFSR